MNRNNVSSANTYNSFWNSNGIANAFDTFSKIQFSTFRRASIHMPAHAVALTHASQRGTVEGVNALKVAKRINQPPTVIKPVIIQSERCANVIFRGALFFFVSQN